MTIWSTPSYKTTPFDAAGKFVLEYWDEPREIHKTWTIDNQLCFSVINGTRTYMVFLDETIRPAQYKVMVLDTERV